jgi:ribonuclease-3 family protein
MIEELDETELWFYKTGRNARNTHHSKSANAVEYRRATGLECLFGYFYISGKHERARTLLRLAIDKSENTEG